MNKLFTEYVIKIKDEDTSLSERYHTYQPLILSPENSELERKVKELFDKFCKDRANTESPEITIRSKTVWQQ